MFQDPDVWSFCSVTQTANNKHNSICSNLYLKKNPNKQKPKQASQNLHDQLSFQFTFIIPTSLLRLHLNMMCYSKFFEANDIQVRYPWYPFPILILHTAFLVPLFYSPNPTFTNYTLLFKWLQWPIFTGY